MSAIEKLKKKIVASWEHINTENEEDIKASDRKIVRKERRLKNFQQLVLYVIVLLIFLWLLFHVVIGIASAPNNDMNPNIRGGDLVTYYRLNKSPSINDVIMFDKIGSKHLGRVIARAGDTVDINKKGGVTVNGNAIVESNIYEGTYPREGLVDYPVKLNENEFFVLSDARESGEDSRYFGVVRKSEMNGVVISVFRRTNL